MGLEYLDGKSWSEVTREERYFCAHLFDLIQKNGAKPFVQYLHDVHEAALDGAQEWEIAFEACFYRDLWQHRGRQGHLYSPKRTFDLCLLSKECIVVIEAKAQQQFALEQVLLFSKDRPQLVTMTGVEKVLVLALVSSHYHASRDVQDHFDKPWLTWADLAGLYGQDKILERADAVYQSNASTYRNGLYEVMTGRQLRKSHEDDEDFIVGRKGGLEGDLLAADIKGKWEKRSYRVNRQAADPLNRNWFWLSEFMGRVTEYERTQP